MKIHAFQGYRYTPQAGDTRDLAAPPFDQIDEPLRDRLHSISPNQYSHFTRPVADSGTDAYAAAAKVHEDWLAGGNVGRDQEASVYPYSIVSPSGQMRWGLCCLVEVGSPEESDLRPHEFTVDKPLEDRLALLRATRIDPEPVMLLAEDDGSFDRQLAADLPGLSAVAEHEDEDGNVHRLYRASDQESISTYQRLLADRGAVIADGHHRTKTAQLFAREVGAQPGTAPAAKMAVIISLASGSLQIDPIHRCLDQPLDLDSLASTAVDRQVSTASNGAELARQVALAPQPSIGVKVGAAPAEIWRLDASQAPESAPQPAHDLSAVLLHHLFLKQAGIELEGATDGTVGYRSDPELLWQQVESGEAATGLWLPTMEPAAFAKAVSEGDVLPPKSTRFLPKLISGLVWSGHDAEVS